MKKYLFLFTCILSFQLCLAQSAIEVTYNQVISKDPVMTSLAPGKILKIKMTAAQDSGLVLQYNDGNTFPKNYSVAYQQTVYQIGTNFTSVEFILPDGTNYGVNLGTHAFIPGNDIPITPVPTPPGGGRLAPARTVTITEVDYTGVGLLDAVKLYKYLATNPTPDEAMIKLIVQNYKTTYVNYADFKKNNPFLTDSFQVPQTTGNTANLNGLLPIASGIDVTKVVQALADFLADRIKQELTIAYLQKLKAALASSPAIQSLLPNTYEAFKDNDLFNLPSLGATFKQAFAQDLATLPDHFISYVYQYQYANLPVVNKELFVAGASTYQLVTQTAKGSHPSVALHSLAGQFPYNAQNALTSRYVLNVVNMFSENLLKSKDYAGWVSTSDLAKLNPYTIRLFFALLYEKYTPLFTANSLSKTLVSLAGDQKLTQLTNNIYNFVMVAQNIDNRIVQLKGLDPKMAPADKAQATLTFFLNNSDALLDLLKYGFSVADPDDAHQASYLAIVKSAGDAVTIAKGIQSDNFAQTTNASITLMTDVLGQSQDIRFIKTLKEIVAFANDMVAAKTAADIKTVLEIYAAPVQSYQAVRKSPFSVSLSAYPGIYAGTEHSKQNGIKLFDQGTFGVTAPIGFALNWGNAKKDVWSETLFISMIDIGAALSYRFNNSSSDIPEKITLGQIFSPGIHGVLGVKNSPLAVKVGYQYAPELRQITTSAVNTSTGGVWRLSLGLCVDIPVFFFSGQH